MFAAAPESIVSFPIELRRYRLLVLVSSLLVGGAGGFALFAAMSLAPGTDSPIPLALFAIVALVVATFGIFFVPRWYHRAGHIVSSTAPMAAFATLTLETDSDSTSLHATVSLPQSSQKPLKHVALLVPRWNVRPLLGSSLSVQIYIDPANSRLVAISTERGMLWCMPTGQVVQASHAA